VPSSSKSANTWWRWRAKQALPCCSVDRGDESVTQQDELFFLARFQEPRPVLTFMISSRSSRFMTWGMGGEERWWGRAVHEMEE
jgi:hypothetical protein